MAIETVTLDNGMQLLLEENHAAKVVSLNALVKVGSVCESDAEAGICHVIEHMLFKGTPARPAGTIARDVEAAGGDMNAYTSIDQTVYYINMASRFAGEGLAILADAIKHPLFDSEELARETEVILEEIRREEDNPGKMAAESLFRTCFRVHPYGRPIIGFPKTVKSFTSDELHAFHRRWYTPHNIVFIVVGDFETKRMLEQVRAQFADFSGPPAPAPEIPEEPVHRSPGLVIKEMNIQSAYLSIGFNVPSIRHPDVPALDVLAHILGGSDASRLEQRIKEEQRLVHNIYAYAFTPKYPGLFSVGATLADADVLRALRAIQGELGRCLLEPVTSEELARAKLAIRSNEIYDRETVGGQAGKIAIFHATAGSHEFEQRYYQMLADVGADRVREVAARYLTPANTTLALVLPRGSRIASRRSALEGTLRPARRPRASKGRAAIAGLARVTLRNGAKLQILENHNHPIVAICAAAIGGTRLETPATNGIAGLMSRAMTKGTAHRSAIEIASDIERIAGHIDGFSGRNTAGVKCEFLSEHLHEGFDVFADVLVHPAFTAAEVAKERRVVLKAIKDQEDALSSLAFAEFLRALFPTHPYGLRVLGTIESVRGLAREDLARFHRNAFCAKDLIITVAGDVNPKEARDLAEELLRDLRPCHARMPKLACDPRPKGPRERIVAKREKQQAHIVIGFQGTTYTSPDRHAMMVLNNILSGQGGRLFRTLRDKMGLAYAVSSVNQDGIEPGYFAVYIATEPSKVETAVKGILKELEGIRTGRASREELSRSQQYLVGVYELDLQRNSTLAAIHTFNALYDLPLDEVERFPEQIMAVTADDVLRAARRYIQPEAYTMAVIKPA
jgi:zinc protease